MIATQVFEKAKSDMPDLEDKIASGDFLPLKQWLNKNIHESGSVQPSADHLLKAVTGSPLQPQVFVSYLKAKYEDIYQL